MPIDVFRDRVDHDIGAVVERVLDIGAEEGVVDDDHDAMSVGDGGDVPDVDQTQGGVAGAFDPDQLGLIRADEIGHVDLNAGREGDLDAMSGGDLGEVAMRAAVDIGDRHDVGALREGLEDEGGGGGAGGEGEGEARMFQRGNCLFEIVSGGRGVWLDRTALKNQVRRGSNRLGFELLVYSYAPTGLPMPVWANVVDKAICRAHQRTEQGYLQHLQEYLQHVQYPQDSARPARSGQAMVFPKRRKEKEHERRKLTDSMTAPVAGSCGLPACTARVPKLCTGDDARGGVSIDPVILIEWDRAGKYMDGLNEGRWDVGKYYFGLFAFFASSFFVQGDPGRLRVDVVRDGGGLTWKIDN